jgi:DNA-binding NtrC family response regulator
MFGHAGGAFTGAAHDPHGKFAAADDGTLFLDELNALPLSVQAKLVRGLEEGQYEPVGGNDCLPLKARVIAASSVPLDEEVLAGRFRADLCYRLSAVTFFLPPLREQPSAVARLCRSFLIEFADRNRRVVNTLSPAALKALVAYHWPGNIRELRNVIERAVSLTRGPTISLEDIPERIVLAEREPVRAQEARSRWKGRSGSPVPEQLLGTLNQVREKVEIQQIRAALQKHQNNRLRAAAELGISRMGLYKKLHKYGLLDLKPPRSRASLEDPQKMDTKEGE